MKFPIDWTSEHDVKNAFVYATRTGIGRMMSMPIGWYQIHQCAALDELEKRARARLACTDTTTTIEVKLTCGVFYARRDGMQYVRVVTSREVFDVADKKARS